MIQQGDVSSWVILIRGNHKKTRGRQLHVFLKNAAIENRPVEFDGKTWSVMSMETWVIDKGVIAFEARLMSVERVAA